MREIVHLQIGQCGNQIGTMFWEKVCAEHKISLEGAFSNDIDQSQSSRHQVYFSRTNEDRFVPRAVLIDLECGTGNVIKESTIGKLFKPDNFIAAQNGAGNNFAKGFYTEGSELLEPAMERIRREVEDCESLQGFQLIHSSGGGTGSGLGSLMITALRDEFSERILSTFTVFPSDAVSEVVVEPYNATLSINHLIGSASNTFVLDNGALYKICENALKISKPSYAEINAIVSDAMCGITACVRFPGQLNSDLRKLSVNLTPFPRLHFYLSSFAPLSSSESQQYRSMNATDITNQMLDSRNMMAGCEPSTGKYFAIAALYRGKVSTKEVEDQMLNYHKKNERMFVDWIPNNVLTASTEVPPANCPLSGTFIGNTTAIQALLKTAQEGCSKMLARKAFLHWYTSEGMDEAEFAEAINGIADLIEEYKSKEGS